MKHLICFFSMGFHFSSDWNQWDIITGSLFQVFTFVCRNVCSDRLSQWHRSRSLWVCLSCHLCGPWRPRWLSHQSLRGDLPVPRRSGAEWQPMCLHLPVWMPSGQWAVLICEDLSLFFFKIVNFFLQILVASYFVLISYVFSFFSVMLV